MGNWKVIRPEYGLNLVLNPSAEIATPANYAAHSGATITRVTTQARFGDYSYFINASSANDGINLTTAAAANAIHYASFYVYGTITGTLRVSTNAGANWNNAAIIGGSTGGWVRYGVQIPAAQANGSVSCLIENTINEDWNLDANQLEQKSYATTYIDGDRVFNTGGSRGLYAWTGLWHASTSQRDPQERGGGRIMDLEDDYGFKVQQHPGAGMPQVTHNLQGYSLQPGAAFQSTKVQARTLYLVSEAHDDSVAGLHAERKALIDIMKPDAVRGAQPFVLGYAGANAGKTVWCAFRYADGLGGGQWSGGAMFLENQIPIQLLAVDPYWVEDNRETAVLGFVSTLDDVNRVMARIGGLWQELGTGFNGICYAIAFDPTTGRVYFGGDFSTANGVTVNGICYWNPTTATFVAMDAGVAAAGQVSTIAIAPNGDVWIGGTFLTAGSALTVCVGLAMWDLSASAWVVPTATATSFVVINRLAIDRQGSLFGGGSFLNFGGVAAADYIFKYSTAGAFTGLGTGMNGQVFALAVGPAAGGTATTQIIYVGGDFTTGNGITLNHVGYWNGTTFVAMGGGLTGTTVFAMAVTRDGNVYAGGVFSASISPVVSMANIGMWNGTGWAPLSSGVVSVSGVYALHFGSDGLLYVAGDYSSIGPFTNAWPGVWNGSSWQQLDISSTAAAPTFFAFLVTPNGDLYVGHDTATIDTLVGSPTTDIVSTNTCSVFPTLTIIGPPSFSVANPKLQEITNLSSKHTLHFDLEINTGEWIGIDLTPGSKRVYSTWRGWLNLQALQMSDFSNFKLLPTRADGAATNTLVTFVTGNTTGMLFLLHWQPAHHSIDGAA